MYLKSIRIKNIRGIEDFKMEFPEGQEAGWHVLLGANGSGKTTVLRAIALALIGPKEILRLDPNWEHWVMKGAKEASIEFDGRFYYSSLPDVTPRKEIGELDGILYLRKNDGFFELSGTSPKHLKKLHQLGWFHQRISSFSAGFGSFRRFSGGNQSLEKHFQENRVVGAHLSLFKEDVALTEATNWLKDQLTRSLYGAKDSRKIAASVLEGIKYLINSGDLLPKDYEFHEISADGAFFKDPKANILPIYELSEGIKSALSIALELLRLILAKYDSFFDEADSSANPISRSGTIDLDGIVLIDEVDAHLHPDWQARIGKWFRKVFPNIQFIVATHSPLVVRAAGDDSQIWWLPAAGSEEKARLIQNGERNRLVYGNVLDAYGTEVFGEQAGRSPEARELMQRLAKLETMALFNKIDDAGLAEIEVLRTKLDL